jgi:hypothetical protein
MRIIFDLSSRYLLGKKYMVLTAYIAEMEDDKGIQTQQSLASVPYAAGMQWKPG